MCLSQSFWVEWEHYVNTNEGLMFGLVLLLSKGSLEENRILTFISYNNASIILAGLMMQQVAPKTMPWWCVDSLSIDKRTIMVYGKSIIGNTDTFSIIVHAAIMGWSAFFYRRTHCNDLMAAAADVS